MSTKKLSVKQIQQKVEKMRSDRQLWENHWQEVADYIIPRKNTITSQKSPGQKRLEQVFDSTGIMSNELLAGALHGLLTNPDAMWFELTTGNLGLDRDDEVRKWLEKTTKDIHNVLNNSNFQTEVHELYIDLCGFGTSSMLTEEDDRDLVRFSTKFIGEYMIDENRMGIVDQIYREWKWDAMKLVAEFGMDKMPKKVQDSYKKADGQLFCIIHAVYPRDMVDPKHKSAYKYISQYVLPDDNIELREAGFREFPYVVPRWSKAAGEKYGRSPGMNALPEVKTLNEMTKTMLIGAQKVVDPPLQLPDDGFIMPIVTKPGGLNYYRSGSTDTIKPVFNDTRIDFGYQAMQDRRQRVREAFYVDQLQLQQGPQMTATEVMQRTEEKMRLLGPMLGRMQSEFLRPLIDRVFEVMVRVGKINPQEVPQALRGQKVDVKYSSLIAKSQRLSEGQNILRAMQAVTPFVNADPTVLDNINGDQAFRAIANIYGLPQEIINDKKQVADKRKARADAQAQALEAEAQKGQIDTAATVTKTMADAQKVIG